MSTRISAKEILAKLMAAENILVEHANVPTAGFDLINRKLLLPNWKNISDDVYTLLISHEVGHALYTPTKEWEDAILNSKDKSIKQVVNIIEDVRIEKMIQAKYPGTIRAFRSGYDELEKSNLFGTKDRSIDSYGLLDRLNLHFKLGHFGYAKVPFSEDESVWLDKISSCKTFSDVLRVAFELKKYVDENEDENTPSESQENSESSQTDGNESDQNKQSLDSSKGEQSRSSSGNSEDGDNENDGQCNSSRPNSSDASEDRHGSPGGSMSAQQNRPMSETQEHFDSAIQSLIDKSIAETRYVNIPDIQLDKIIIPYKTVHDQISNYYTTYFSEVYNKAQDQVEKFKASSKNTVNQLANIFEMKKKAKLDVRALTSKTGKLDTNKVHSYRYNDDIFKKLTVVPQGKSHGLVMFIDMSSSMCDNISGTYEQLLNLVLFCRRVSIPFEVYGFTDAPAARCRTVPKHPSKVGDLTFDDFFCLRNYFSSKMSGPDFNKALQNIICIMRHHSSELYAGLPAQETLNTTPLVPAALAATKLVKNFRDDNGLDVVNTIFLTDGEDTHGLSYNDGITDCKYLSGRFSPYSTSRSEKCYVRDVKSRKQWEIKNTTADMMNILREIAGVKTIGFHIIKKKDASYMISRLSDNHIDQEKKIESFKTHKFCELTNAPGFDAYYLIPSGNNLNVQDDEFSGNVDTTIDWEDEKQAKRAMKQVTKNFNNFMKQRVTSRILLNRFIDHIS